MKVEVMFMNTFKLQLSGCGLVGAWFEVGCGRPGLEKKNCE